MQVLNKYEKEKLAIQMHKEGKTIREIAAVAHMSFGDIGKIIRRLDGSVNGQLLFVYYNHRNIQVPKQKIGTVLPSSSPNSSSISSS